MLDTVKHTPGAIDIHAADGNDPANDSAQKMHQLSRLATRAKNQVDHNLRRELSDLVPVLRQSVAVPLDLPYLATGAASATVKHGNVMSRPVQLPQQWRADESVSADDENTHSWLVRRDGPNQHGEYNAG
jgi:hypothetical protein